MPALIRNFQQSALHSNLPATPASTWGTHLTAHATPHSKGAWATLMTTTADVCGFWVGAAAISTSATQTDMMLDIAIGPTQDIVIVPELLIGWRGSVGAGPLMYYIPIYIPSGTLVSGRIQALITVDTAEILMFANEGGTLYRGPLFSGCDAYGTVIAASQGTSHTPGNTGAYSTDANIGGTTTKAYGAVLLGVGGTLSNTTMNDLRYHWDLRVGSTTLGKWYHSTTSLEVVYGPFPPAPVYCSIPTSTQLQVRSTCSGAAQAQDVAFYAFY